MEHELRKRREWLAAQYPDLLEQFDSHRRAMSDFDMQSWLYMTQSVDLPLLYAAFSEIYWWEPELEALHREITSTENHLRWFAEARLEHARTK